MHSRKKHTLKQTKLESTQVGKLRASLLGGHPFPGKCDPHKANNLHSSDASGLLHLLSSQMLQ